MNDGGGAERAGPGRVRQRHRGFRNLAAPQAIVFDPGANALGITTSNGGHGTIGS